jgi:hypothetical protein
VKSKASWQDEYKTEIEHAVQARLGGNEGMARVCARRAAGIVIGEYLHRHGYLHLTTSAYDRLTLFSSLPEIDQLNKQIADHLLTKVDHDRKLPLDIDLVSEVMWLKKSLLNGNTN